MSSKHHIGDYTDKTGLDISMLFTLMSEVHMGICDIVEGLPILLPLGVNFVIKGIISVAINGIILMIGLPLILIKNIF